MVTECMGKEYISSDLCITPRDITTDSEHIINSMVILIPFVFHRTRHFD